LVGHGAPKFGILAVMVNAAKARSFEVWRAALTNSELEKKIDSRMRLMVKF